VLVKTDANVIIVGNEVGMGVVPPYPLGRFYRDIAGYANQLAAEKADEVYFMMAGIPLKIKG
ncbi:MAG: bifunctional adenosylcobinamide kinase/adenosylcobinamide-phosphate guanylyltransferase, partial [Actinobacteria bacterium]|nr:bifunctional adenosylcobinamide kinase/adenosylcobinamide-phosphate guanylyltransferase [Actinomycetota bacterium]